MREEKRDITKGGREGKEDEGGLKELLRGNEERREIIREEKGNKGKRRRDGG